MLAGGGQAADGWPSAAARSLGLVDFVEHAAIGKVRLLGDGPAAELADNWYGAAPADKAQFQQLTRTALILLQGLQMPLLFSFALAIIGFASITARNHLVPRWLGYEAGAAAAAV